MLAADAFRPQLHAAIETLRAWSRGLADCATIDEAEAADHWRVTIAPHAPAACPVELILHAGQRFDIAIGPETYEDQPLDDIALFASLLGAIAEGRVVTRTWSTQATGAVVETETVIDLSGDGGAKWAGSRADPVLGRLTTRDACEARTRHYAPYRSPPAT